MLKTSRAMDDFQKNSLRLRDSLAVERTKMANERTLMAYIRTSFMFLAGGVSLIELYPDIAVLQATGFTLFPISLFLFVIGVIRFHRVKKGVHKNVDE